MTLPLHHSVTGCGGGAVVCVFLWNISDGQAFSVTHSYYYCVASWGKGPGALNPMHLVLTWVRCRYRRDGEIVFSLRSAGDGAPGARGAAAGVLARDAQRHAGPEDGEHASPDEVREGIRSVAEELGSPPERLLMVDYQQRVVDDEELPDLTDVFAAFGTWKRARRESSTAA